MKAAKWLSHQAILEQGPKLKRELRALQAQRKHHEMLLPIELETLDTGKTRVIKALLDNGCTTTCMDRGYAEAEGYELKELDKPIKASNADGSENTQGNITHYTELIMTIGPHVERQRFLITGLGKARVFI
ncbi:hypothetical protein C8R47DRAFT_994756, partial [Mycena vitilis]